MKYASFLLLGILIILLSSIVSSLEYFHSDHLGNNVLITDEEGNLVENINYEPYGNSENDERYKFNDKEDDGDLYYYESRYYDDSLGRFVQPDSIIPSSDPEHLNRYSYVRNNPVNRIDPSGGSDEYFGDVIITANNDIRLNPVIDDLILPDLSMENIMLDRDIFDTGNLDSIYLSNYNVNTVLSDLSYIEKNGFYVPRVGNIYEDTVVNGIMLMNGVVDSWRIDNPLEIFAVANPILRFGKYSEPIFYTRNYVGEFIISKLDDLSLPSVKKIPKHENIRRLYTIDYKNMRNFMKIFRKEGFNRANAIEVLEVNGGYTTSGKNLAIARAMDRLGETTIPARIYITEIHKEIYQQGYNVFSFKKALDKLKKDINNLPDF